jgi:hypothetical protein
MKIASIIAGFTLISAFAAGAPRSFLDEKLRIDETVKSWVSCHNDGHAAAFASLYDQSVIYYGSKLTIAACIAKKETLLAEHLDFVMMLSSGIHYTPYENGIVRCDFIKSVSYGNVNNESPAYLVLQKNGNVYRIIAESDRETDKKSHHPLALGSELTLEEFAAANVPPEVVPEDTGYSWWWLAAGIAVVVPTGYMIFRRRRPS